CGVPRDLHSFPTRRSSDLEADALGKLPPPLPELPEGATESDVEQVVWQQLRTCFDPEIPVNIVDLGLVYECVLSRSAEGGYRVRSEEHTSELQSRENLVCR